MTCKYSLLDEKLINVRLVATGEPRSLTLPGLLAAMKRDEIRDFPALRPHQRHPWHAFLVQVAAIALHQAEQADPFSSETEWRDALIALTPEDPDGAAWCLLSPPERPAFMQPPVPGETPSNWKNKLVAPDQIDMLINASNHDLKTARMKRSQPFDWALALVSLQTQAGYNGAGNYGISRMNGGASSRTALGAVPKGNCGRRWQRDIGALLDARTSTVATFELNEVGISLVWLLPWDGDQSLTFGSLDPFYIDVSRRIRLQTCGDQIIAFASTSKTERIRAKQLHGQTGDAWTPIDVSKGAALGLGSKGFDYRLVSELLFGSGSYRQPIAMKLRTEDGLNGIVILAQAIQSGRSKTGGYHERRIPISPSVRRMLRNHQIDEIGAAASERTKAIGEMTDILERSIATLFNKGLNKFQTKKQKEKTFAKARRFSQSFIHGEDHLFFPELNAEIEADNWEQARLDWLTAMALRAEQALRHAFEAGPCSSEQRYRARAEALSRFRGSLRGENSPLPELASYYQKQAERRKVSNAIA